MGLFWFKNPDSGVSGVLGVSGVSGVSSVSGDSLKKTDLAYGSKNHEKKVKIFLSDFQ